MSRNFRILILNDGNKGNFIQSCGIAQNFPSSKIDVLKIELKGLKYKLPKRKGKYPLLLKFLNLFCYLRFFKTGILFLKLYSKKIKEKMNKNYDFIISTGSLLSPVNILLSKKLNAYSIQIMVPDGVPLSLFDFLIVPYHDYIRLKNKGRNVITTLGSPNMIDEKMKEEAIKKIPEWVKKKIRKKIISVLIGGNDQNYKISLKWIENFKRGIEKMKNKFQFYLTTSRRTDEKVVSFIIENFKNDEDILFIEIPDISNVSIYPSILFLSDVILVTEDSINMISEAASTGKRVIILGVERKTDKKLIFDYTIEKFVEKGYSEYIPYDKVIDLSDIVEEVLKKKYKKLNEAKICVQKILQNIN